MLLQLAALVAGDAGALPAGHRDRHARPPARARPKPGSSPSTARKTCSCPAARVRALQAARALPRQEYDQHGGALALLPAWTTPRCACV